MSVSDSRGKETEGDLARRLEAEIRLRKELEVRVSEKESEAECAAAWAQAASEAVSALEEQLENTEAELDSALFKLKAYENNENPWSSKEEAFRQVILQLNESQTREEEMYQQAEDMQGTLLEVQEKLKKRDEMCTTYESEIAKLKNDLSAGERRVSELVSECASTASAWEEYNKVKGEMDRTLGSHLAQTGMNGDGGAQQMNRSMEDYYRMEDQVHEMEQLLAQMETNLLEERNGRAKLQEENESLHKYVLKLQDQLYNGNSVDS